MHMADSVPRSINSNFRSHRISYRLRGDYPLYWSSCITGVLPSDIVRIGQSRCPWTNAGYIVPGSLRRPLDLTMVLGERHALGPAQTITNRLGVLGDSRLAGRVKADTGTLNAVEGDDSGSLGQLTV